MARVATSTSGISYAEAMISRVDICAQFLLAARSFPESATTQGALSGVLPDALAKLKEAAVYVELIVPQLDGPREALMKAAHDLERTVSIGASKGRIDEDVVIYREALVALRDPLRAALGGGAS